MKLLEIGAIAYGIALLSLLAPGMLNMTAVAVALDKGKKQALQFSVGAAVAVFLQAFVALYFSKYLAANPMIVDFLTQAAVVIFVVLAVFFWTKARGKNKIQTKKNHNNQMQFGFGLALLNMLSVPFYLAVSTSLIASGTLPSMPIYTFVFSFFAALGACSIFALYVQFSEFIRRRASFVAQNINYILCALFVVLAVVAWAK